MALAYVLTSAAEGNSVQDRYVVLDHSCLTDDHAGCVIDHDAAADTSGGMGVDAEQLGDPALQKQRQLPAFAEPQPIFHPLRLDRLESLEKEQRLQMGAAGRIALIDRDQIGAGGGGDIGGLGVAFIEDLAYEDRRNLEAA